MPRFHRAADTGNGDDSGSEQSAFMGDLEVAGTGETRDDDMLVTPEMAAVVWKRRFGDGADGTRAACSRYSHQSTHTTWPAMRWSRSGPVCGSQPS